MQQIRLSDLPNDVLQLIIQSLDLGTLFVPRYKNEDFEYFGNLSEYSEKCKEYYGESTDDREKRAQGLISWSASNRHFRSLLLPYVLDTIVLRDKPKSIDSVQLLMGSDKRNLIRHLSFAFTMNSSKQRVNNDESGRDNGGINIPNSDAALRDILSQLPPNLRTLTLDFPESSDDPWEALGEDWPDDDENETDPYRVMLRNALTWVSKNDVSEKAKFELKLHNIAPYHSLAYELESWKTFLSGVTSFTLGLKSYDNGAGWRMNVHEPASQFARRLGEFFWDHLSSVQSLHLQNDSTWPLGAPEALMHPLELPLPSIRRWQNLKHVSFRETFICKEMVHFLVAHKQTVETIALQDCFAPDEFSDAYESFSDSEGETWASFFKQLVKARPPALRAVEIVYVSRSLDDLIDRYNHSNEESANATEVREFLREQEQSLEDISNEEELRSATIRHKKLLAYCTVDDKYGMIFDQGELNLERFLDGEDHDQWLKLVNLLSQNAASCKV